jgi:3-dehydroquinate synthase
MAKAGLDRTSFVVAFGGGSIGDAAGFAAATYMRGIRLVQIPTTLLSMVDSSVGGKTGVNLVEGKNLVGSFHQPGLVLADLSLLRTLPARERRSGVYEVVKCGLLRNEALLTLVERTRGLRQATDEDLETAIAAAVRIKARIVERDERESGERVLLNLGHTLGHALEAATAYRRFTHGEAVGYGMEFAVDLGEALGLTDASAARRMRAAIRAVGPRTPLDRSMVAAAQKAALGDKKREGDGLKEILLRGPGQPLVQRFEARRFAAVVGKWLSARVP